MAKTRKSTRVARVRTIRTAALLVGAVAGGAVAYQVFGRDTSRPPAGGGGAAPEPGRTTRPGGPVVLQQGQSGAQVKQVQQALLNMGGQPAQIIRASGGADGRYGPGLVRALQAAGAPNPGQLNKAAVTALLKKGQLAVTATKRKTGVLPTSPAAAPVAPTRQQGAGASGKVAPAAPPLRLPQAAPVDSSAARLPPLRLPRPAVDSSAAVRPRLVTATAQLPTARKPASPPITAAKRADLLRQRQVLINAINARDFSAAYSVLVQVRNVAEYGVINAPVKFVGDSVAVSLSRKLLASFPSNKAALVGLFEGITTGRQ